MIRNRCAEREVSDLRREEMYVPRASVLSRIRPDEEEEDAEETYVFISF